MRQQGTFAQDFLAMNVGCISPKPIIELRENSLPKHPPNHLPSPSVIFTVTTDAKRSQVVHHIATELAPEFYVMDLQVHHGTALLAPPAISFEPACGSRKDLQVVYDQYLARERGDSRIVRESAVVSWILQYIADLMSGVSFAWQLAEGNR